MPQHAICSSFLSLATPAMHALTPGNRSSSMLCDAGTWWRWQTAPRQTTVLSSSVQTTAVTAVKADTIRGVVCPPCFDVTQFPPSPRRFPHHAHHHLGACKRSAAMFPSSQRSEIFQSSWSLTPSSFQTSSTPSFFFLLFFGFELFVVRVRARACRTCIPRVAREAVRYLLLQCLQCRPLTLDWHQQTVFRGRTHE